MRSAELIRYLVLAAQREGNRRLTREFRPLGVTPSQAEVIRVLAEHGSLTLTGLGELLVCESGTNPSRLVDRLADAGLVDRVVDRNDRRSVLLSLTPKGQDVESKIRSVERDLYADLDASTEGVDLSAALDVLQRLSAGQPAGQALAARIAARGDRAGTDATEARS
jgi:MarR family transcriptional regulator, organic hydroperoxide resistance regulator